MSCFLVIQFVWYQYVFHLYVPPFLFLCCSLCLLTVPPGPRCVRTYQACIRLSSDSVYLYSCFIFSTIVFFTPKFLLVLVIFLPFSYFKKKCQSCNLSIPCLLVFLFQCIWVSVVRMLCLSYQVPWRGSALLASTIFTTTSFCIGVLVL